MSVTKHNREQKCRRTQSRRGILSQAIWIKEVGHDMHCELQSSKQGPCRPSASHLLHRLLPHHTDQAGYEDTEELDRTEADELVDDGGHGFEQWTRTSWSKGEEQTKDAAHHVHAHLFSLCASIICHPCHASNFSPTNSTWRKSHNGNIHTQQPEKGWD